MDPHQITQTRFVLLQAGWPVTKGRALVEALKPPHVIARCSNPEEYYYLYSVEEALTRLNQAADVTAIQVAFDLHETEATPLLEAHTDAEDAPDRCIMQEDGRLLGFFDASVPPVISSRRGTAGTGAPAEALSRSVVAEFPERVKLDEVNSLFVSLSASEAGSSGISIPALPPGTTVDIAVQSRRGLALEGRVEGSLQITDSQETLSLQFKLRSTSLGSGQIRVLALHEGIALGAMTLTPTVIAPSTETATASPTSQEQPLAPITRRVPDLSLLIGEAWVDSGNFRDAQRALSSGEYDGWHFTGHGGYRASDPNRSGMLLERGETFCPRATRGRGDQPGRVLPAGLPERLLDRAQRHGAEGHRGLLVGVRSTCLRFLQGGVSPLARRASNGQGRPEVALGDQGRRRSHLAGLYGLRRSVCDGTSVKPRLSSSYSFWTPPPLTSQEKACARVV